MPFSQKLLRPVRSIAAAVATIFMKTAGGDFIVTQGGDRMRTIQNG